MVNKNDAIDVAFQTASNDELLRQESASVQESEDALREIAEEVQRDPNRCFCRNCGNPVFTNASVCPTCSYVINPTSLRQAQQLIRARRQKYEKGHKIFSTIRQYTGVDLESDVSKAHFNIRPQHYEYQTSGAVYCSNCGHEVDEGASVCIYCNYVINPLAVQQAQLAVSDRNAKLTKGDIIKSLLIPGWGLKTAKKFALRRPQIANPCRIAGLINTGALTALIFLFLNWL